MICYLRKTGSDLYRLYEQVGNMLRLICIAVVCTMLLIPIAGYSSNVISNKWALIAVSFGLAYVVIPAVLLKLWPASRTGRHKSMQEALDSGELHTADYEIRDVVQIGETEDEGLHFLIDLGDEKTLFLSGQYLYEPVERGEFPAERVRVFTNKVTGLRYGIESIGTLRRRWQCYEPLTLKQIDAGVDLVDGELYQQSIAQLAERFGLRPSPVEGGSTRVE